MSDNDGYNHRADNDHNDSDVPGWMVGYFHGYNRTYGAEVALDISRDGSVVATVNGKRSYGEFRKGKLRMGLFSFYVDRTNDGLDTRQKDDEDNIV